MCFTKCPMSVQWILWSVRITASAEENSLKWKNNLNSGFNYNPLIEWANENDIWSVNIVCAHCKAFMWKSKSASLCCSSGKLWLDPIFPPPELLNH